MIGAAKFLAQCASLERATPEIGAAGNAEEAAIRDRFARADGHGDVIQIAKTKEKVMKRIADAKTRKKLLEQFRNAACIELALWSTCLAIEALLGDGFDVVTRIFQLGRDYAGMTIHAHHLEEILFETGARNIDRTVVKKKRLCVMGYFDKEWRRKLLRATQTAVCLHRALIDEAEAIAEIVDCELDTVVNFFAELSEDANVGLEVTEMDLGAFLGEPVEPTLSTPQSISPSLQRGRVSQRCQAEKKGYLTP